MFKSSITRRLFASKALKYRSPNPTIWKSPVETKEIPSDLTKIPNVGKISISFNSLLYDRPLKLKIKDGWRSTLAERLFQLGNQYFIVNDVTNELTEVMKKIHSTSVLVSYLTNQVDGVKRRDVLGKVLSDAKVSPMIKSYFEAAAENGFLKDIDQCYDNYLEYCAAEAQIVHCKVTSAYPLESADTDKIKRIITENFLKKGQVVGLETAVDNSLIGGFSLQVGDKALDMTLANRLKKIENEYLNNYNADYSRPAPVSKGEQLAALAVGMGMDINAPVDSKTLKSDYESLSKQASEIQKQNKLVLSDAEIDVLLKAELKKIALGESKKL